jgi:hypothetical protein
VDAEADETRQRRECSTSRATVERQACHEGAERLVRPRDARLADRRGKLRRDEGEGARGVGAPQEAAYARRAGRRRGDRGGGRRWRGHRLWRGLSRRCLGHRIGGARRPDDKEEEAFARGTEPGDPACTAPAIIRRGGPRARRASAAITASRGGGRLSASNPPEAWNAHRA